MCDPVLPQTEISFFQIMRDSTGTRGLIVSSELLNRRGIGGYVPSGAYGIGIVVDRPKMHEHRMSVCDDRFFVRFLPGDVRRVGLCRCIFALLEYIELTYQAFIRPYNITL